MLKNTEIRLDTQTRRNIVKVRLMAGLQSVFRNRKCAAVTILHIAVLTVIFLFREQIIRFLCPNDMIYEFMHFSYSLFFTVYVIISIFALLILMATPMGARYVSDKLHRAGVVNAIDEPPLLLRRYKDSTNSNITILDFMTAGIARAELEELQPQIESALGAYIVKIVDGPGRNRILLYTVQPENCIPDIIIWNKDTPISNDSVLIFGQTIAGTDVTFDIEKIPHILIGGSTGSGKTVLLRFLLKQCFAKGYKVFLADFKGGIDYPGEWHQSCSMITDTIELISFLTDIVSELYRRKDLFLARGAANISEYNRNGGETLTHIIFAVDELAELLDKTGASKDQKAQIDEVISMMSTIARLGRAFGINLILSTQRPDANILPGQIKNNLDIRICGRADNVLSQIILDTTSAADRIPKESHYFLTQDGTLFQPYLRTD